VTTEANWTSSDTLVATIAMNGLAKAEFPGQTVIKAMYEGLPDSTTLTVTPVLESISVNPENPSVSQDSTLQFIAIATYSNDSTDTVDAEWSSSNTSIATIGMNTGLARGVMPGDATITAEYEGFTDAVSLKVTKVTVSLAIAPRAASVADGATLQYMATATYSDSSTDTVTASVTWSSDDTLVVTIEATTGLARGVFPGSATIKGVYQRNFSDATAITVTPVPESLAIAPKDSSVADKSTLQFVATVTYSNGEAVTLSSGARWTSSDTAIATIGASTGVAQGEFPGQTTITAMYEGLADSTALTVTPVQVSLAVTPETPIIADGSTQQFTLTVTYSDDSDSILISGATWTSSNTSVATIDENTGVATGVSDGATTITATYMGLTDTATLTVLPDRITINFSVPAMSFRSICFPLTGDNTVGSLLEELGSPDNNKRWRFGHWSPESGSYVEGSTSTPIRIGEGYWLITSESRGISATGFQAPPASFEVDLEGGPGDASEWNQIGNPFNFCVNVGDLLVSNGGEPIPFSFGNGIAERPIQEWTGSGYAEVSVLEPLRGYWVKKLAAGEVTLIFPYEPCGSAAKASGPAAGVAAGGVSAEWSITITGQQGAMRPAPLVVGAAAVPVGEWHPLDQSSPPPPPGNYLELYIPKTDWGRMNGRYEREYKPETETMTWEFVVEGGEVPGEAKLGIEASELPGEMRLWLTDLADGSERPLEGNASLAIALTGEPHRYRLTAAGAGVDPEGASFPIEGFVQAYPNPFRERVGFRFKLREPGPIEVSIYDATGRLVRKLARETAPAGENVLVWDGQNALGNELSSGVYLARYRVVGDAGSVRILNVK